MPGLVNDFPVRNLQLAYNIDGNHTEIVLSTFKDRIFIVVTQLGKLGTMIEATCSHSADGMGRNSFNVSTLLGRRDEPLYQVFARSLIESISATDTRPLLFCIALKDESSSTMRQIKEVIIQNRIW